MKATPISILSNNSNSSNREHIIPFLRVRSPLETVSTGSVYKGIVLPDNGSVGDGGIQSSQKFSVIDYSPNVAETPSGVHPNGTTKQ